MGTIFLPRITPRKAFQLDAFGAAFSFIMLMAVVYPNASFFGLPEEVIRGLAFPIIAFIVYSSLLYLWNPKNIYPYLNIIGTANLLYSFTTIGFLVYFSETATVWGWMYFLGESAIIAMVSYIEFTRKRLE